MLTLKNTTEILEFGLNLQCRAWREKKKIVLNKIQVDKKINFLFDCSHVCHVQEPGGE